MEINNLTDCSVNVYHAYMSPTRGRPREFDTEQALDAAMLVFWSNGYEATGVTELCQAMGIGKQSLYDWLGDKKSLFLAVLERYRQTHVCGLGFHLGQEGSPIGNLRHCLQAFAEYAKSPACKGCLLTNTKNEFGTSDPDIAKATEGIETYIADAFVQVLKRARDAGEISETIDCQAMGSALAVLRNGIMIAGRSGQSAESIDQTIEMIEALLKAG